MKDLNNTHENQELNKKLARAVNCGYTNEVKMLLEQGGDVNFKYIIGDNLLMRAAFYGHYDIVDLLLNWGADIFAVDSHDLTALDLAQKANRSMTSELNAESYKAIIKTLKFIGKMEAEHPNPFNKSQISA